ncbi:hypothetical protein CPB86DRAFT_711262, partial [Serendipita vermifera]
MALHAETEPSIWQLYNQRAKVRDKALLDHWKSSINHDTVIFSGLFATVVTAFCVESRKLLQEDPLDSIKVAMWYMAERQINPSTPFTPPRQFKQDKWVIFVNGLLFTSLTCSLIAALMGLTCLHWVKEYEHGANNKLPFQAEESRALHRHYQYQGAKNWLMDEMIATAPNLLYMAAICLFTGLAIWLWHSNWHIALVLLVGMLTVATWYIITALFAVWSPSAPFKTPISK